MLNALNISSGLLVGFFALSGLAQTSATQQQNLPQKNKKLVAGNTTAKQPMPAKVISTKKPASVSASTSTMDTQKSLMGLDKSAIVPNQSLSEFAFHSAQDQSSMIIAPVLSQSDTGTKIRGEQKVSTATEKSNVIGFRYNRGFASNWSGSVATSVGAKNNESQGQSTVHSTGFSDVEIKAQQLIDRNDSQIFWGGNFSYSLENKVIASKNDDGNLYSGGHTLAPFVGIQKNTGDSIIGGQLSYQYFMQRKGEQKFGGTNIEMNLDGGNTLSAVGFTEFSQQNIHVGLHGGVDFVSASEFSTQVFRAKSTYTVGSYSQLNVGAYARFAASKYVEVLPHLRLSKQLDSSGGSASVENRDETSLEVAARFAL